MELFPNIEPFNTFHLPVSDLHTIYVEESGNKNGKPVIFLHGGPGGGVDPKYRRYFNPDKWRIIMFDQRGCGKSTPFAELKENTTWDLVDDIEKIRNHLSIDNWVVFGGSWGSTLSLAYSQTYPNSCKGLILRGIFLVRKKEIDWFYQEGANNIFPDRWESFLAPIPVEKRDNLMQAYYEILTGDDHCKKIEAAKAWSTWEGSTVRLMQDENFIARVYDNRTGMDVDYKINYSECDFRIVKRGLIPELIRVREQLGRYTQFVLWVEEEHNEVFDEYEGKDEL